jgi:rRNA maturation endonuclease Nob1
MMIAIACILTAGVVLYILGVRPKDLPEPLPVSPFQHLDERKAAIYENLRDLQFEYRVGKLSDADYQQTKKDLQKELAQVLAEVDRVREQLGGAKPAKAIVTPPAKPDKDKFVCPSCNAEFEKDLKFCGECGKPMRKVEV